MTQVNLHQIAYVGKGSVPIVDMHDVANFRQAFPHPHPS